MAINLGKTASVSLVTAIPGSYKSARMVQCMRDLIADGELVYGCNIEGLKLKGVIPWEDPTNWYDLPPGAILFVDEAQNYFRARRGGEPPKYITDMETIRHEGVRLVLVTQQPNYLDTHLRGLIGYHEHLIREKGKDKSFVFRTDHCMEQVRISIKKAKSLYDYEMWAPDKTIFGEYKSAQVHTVQYAMPSLVKKALVLAPIALALFVGTWFFIFRDAAAQIDQGKGAEAKTAALPPSQAGAVSLFGNTPGAPQKVRTAGDYFNRFMPLVEGIAWTAPAWVDQPVRSEPHVFCIEGGAGYTDAGYKPAGVTCLTEQGTPVEMDPETARKIARHGEPYNPYKAPDRSQEGRRSDAGAGQRPAAMAAPAAAPAVVGVGQAGDLQAPYGQFRSEPQSAP